MKVEEAIAANIRKKKVPLFSTEESVDVIIERMDLKGEVVVAIMMTINTILETLAKEIQDGNLSK